ncbi:SRPBCC domain-containing protein [Spongiactinospora gelatinilytica]|uniref:SRPBCC domain-containing protein n=1 Tax=Spongiactinospora gelatinilytica TaxID=2666298 RepID=A0A2W2FVF7_9ACTN|nr:SRPBCC domain-containing protein [Spongiactinospora gelatinilytica]PZG39773.1 SRPBCC domain-containing protein [Spongiactinospora gelatinilytica]
MRTVEVSTEIAASRRMVWAVLTDFPRYPEWATYIQRIEGQARTGGFLKVTLGPPDRPPHVFRAPVLEATPEVRLAWAAVIPGATWLPRAIFTGVHEFVLDALPDGGTRLTHREHFSGLLARLSDTGPPGGDEGFTAFNNALQYRAEDPGNGSAE